MTSADSARVLAAMFRSELGGRLTEEGERRYYELSFLAGYCNGYLPTQELSDEHFELEASADPTQTSTTIDYSRMGREYRIREFQGAPKGEPVHVTDPDFWERIGWLEGELWARHQQHDFDCDPNYSVNGAIRWLNTEANPDDSWDLFEVYGSAGWNRYYVQSDGFIRFSTHHGSRDKTKLAAALGFILH